MSNYLKRKQYQQQMEKESKNIKDLLMISSRIYELYEKLAEYEITDNQEQYQKTLEYLNMCIELENKFYKKLPVTIETVEQTMKRIQYLNIEQNLYKKELIEIRIGNYILNRYYVNPFHYSVEEGILGIKKNILGIKNQIYLDYNQLVTYFFNQKIDSIKSAQVKEKLIRKKYKYILLTKLSEKNLIFNSTLEFPTPSSREKVLIFNQDENLVQQCFFSAVSDIIIESFNCFFETYNIEMSYLDKVCDREECLVEIKAVMYMLEDGEVRDRFPKLIKELSTFQEIPAEVISNITSMYTERLENPHRYTRKKSGQLSSTE